MSTSILVAGTPNTTVHVAQSLKEQGYIIVGTLCPFPKPVGRKQILTPCALDQWSTQHNIPVFHVDRNILRDPEFLMKLPQCDILVVADFGFLVPQALLDFPKYHALNIHPSLLPKWRGASPVPFTILFDEKETGVTIIRMNSAFDAGSIVKQTQYTRVGNETSPQLLETLFHLGTDTLLECLPEYIEGKISPVSQQEQSPTPQARKFTKEDGYIPFDALREVMSQEKTDKHIPLLDEYHIEKSAQNVHNMIHALLPWPGSWTVTPKEKRIKLMSASVQKSRLILDVVQIEGKNPTKFSDVKQYFE